MQHHTMKTPTAVAVADVLLGIDLLSHEWRGLAVSYSMIPKQTGEALRMSRAVGRLVV